MTESADACRIEAGLDSENHSGLELGVVPDVEERPLVVAKADRVPDMVLPVIPEPVLVVIRAHGAVDVRAARSRLHRLECRVLERDHVVEQLALLRRRLSDHHRALELRVVPHTGAPAPVTSTSPSWKTMLFASA